MNLKIEMTIEQANVVLKALSKLTWEEANELIVTIKKQAGEQLKAEAKPEENV